jgi:ABC-type multidrug transport system fused ATPase/permease subunit
MELRMSFGDFLWSLLVIYFIFFYFMILFRIVGDLFSDHEANGWVKSMWLIFLLFVPFIATCVYLIARGGGMAERELASAEAADAAQQAYIREVAGRTEDPATQITEAQSLLQTGAITTAEFETLKAKALA